VKSNNAIGAGLDLSVLLIVFNRPDATRQVFDAIRQAKPQRLFVKADGPRPDRKDDEERCQMVRQICSRVDWDCELLCNFSDSNVGCRRNVAEGINWFFEHVEEGIILEDDCLPCSSFFYFCKELLERYRLDDRIMQISGSNYLFGKKTTEASYYFSKRNDVWGWATWRRAWKYFDEAFKDYDRKQAVSIVNNYFGDIRQAKLFQMYLDEAYGRNVSVWSTQWTYAICRQNGLIAVSNVNMVKNIGFNREATHGSGDSWSLYSNAEVREIDVIRHPQCVEHDREADRIRFDVVRRTDPRLIPREIVRSFLKRNIIARAITVYHAIMHFMSMSLRRIGIVRTPDGM